MSEELTILMNLDRLKKLVMLANHNPNDPEANRAARLVCKMIEEADFVFHNPIPPTIQPVTTWKDVERNKEPDFKSTRTGPATDWMNWYEKWQRQARESQEARTRSYDAETKSEPAYKSVEYDYYGIDWGKAGPFEWDGPYKRKPKRHLKCKTCGYIHETVFQGLPELFECNPCQWTAYQKSQNK